MENKKYRKFLEKQSEKNPVNVEGFIGSRNFKISWNNTREEPVRSGSSDILGSIYLRKTWKKP